MNKGVTMKRFWYIILVIALVVVIGISAFFGYNYFNQPVKPTETTTTKAQETTKYLPDNPIDFASLKKKNSDIFSWIKIDNTNINYPILYPNNKKNDYYLRKNIYGEYDRQGVIWIENYNHPDWNDPVTLVYGHNIWTKGTMFYQLKKYRDEKFFEKNRFIQIYAEGRELKYEVYSAFEYDDRHIMLSYDFSNEKVYQKFIDYTLNPVSLSKNVRKNMVVTTNDKLIILSTCIKGKEDMRYLVVGVQREDVQTK